MPHIPLLRGTRSGVYTSPRTVLGFYAGVLGLLEVGVVAVSIVLASQSSLHYLFPYVLGFGALVFITLVAIVVLINVRDPTKLQLGQVSGREFIEYQATVGDSASGQRAETLTLPLGGTDPQTPKTMDDPGRPPAIEPPATES
jgi:hypothetical protein